MGQKKEVYHVQPLTEGKKNIHGWGSVYNEFCIMYEGRMPE